MLVDEDNPYSTDPRYALYPYPVNSAGHRLQSKVMGASLSDYLAMGRENLCLSRWSTAGARDGVARVVGAYHPDAPLVLLGVKVARAFGLRGAPFTWGCHPVPAAGGPERRVVVFLPHPSGRCRAWNDPDSYESARRALRGAGVVD